jgi:tetratricopeptide (TPR) repeat protein
MKRFAIIAIFLSLLFVGNAHAENQSTTDYKIEQIKEDIKKLETDLKKLEDDVDDSKDNKLENKKDLESLDKRIDDVGGSVDRFGVLVAFFSIFITLLIVSFGFVAYKNARGDAKKQAEDATKEWIENEGNRQLEPIVNKLEENFKQLAEKKTDELNQLLKEFKKEHKKQLDKYESDFKQLKANYTSQEKEVIDKNAKESENKDVKTFDDYWNILLQHYTKSEFNKMLLIFEKAEKLENLSNQEKSNLLNSKGFTYYTLKEYEKAIEYFKKAIEINPQNDGAYTNLFEIQLTLNKPFELENFYVNLFKDNKETFIRYEMLKILQSIVNKKNVNIENWKEKYNTISFDDSSWYELDTWISNMQDGEIKTKLSEALKVFKNHNKSCE